MKKILLSLSVIGMIAGGCNNSDKKVERAQEEVQDAKKDLAEAKQEQAHENAVATERTDMDHSNAEMSDYQKFKADMQAKINENQRQIDTMKVRMANEKKDKKDRFNKRIDKIEKENAELRARIENYPEEKDASKWDAFKREFNHDMDELGAAMKDIVTDNEK